MRFHFEDESERALLASRLGHAGSVGDTDLAASVANWITNKPRPVTAPRLKPSDLEDIQAVADWDDVEAAGPGGYRSNNTGWIGVG